ncbi:UDP-N-acetylmuramoyl-tripeptide--D-alanyl-D-alanine ligase [Micrococcus luteus]|uniref:UDP-N-acetylmuramoyl-tripeptide--D-alanyl-D- alanine ligase n=1 Tax=Micrococcus luteus TaxID=1270 RepID=UPI00119DF5E9|nr:UDP-N-acetylmuramoyl-tripeptide--D-alanyl-D-alanine ligase [Micrococcus luteus]QGS21057.1 UDP-N-acetylmuramoyl-tripeptide--D-alanyl-D-alanine ligase [Micrococcus luteus]QHG59973.1 UDP-N-acetylmuramoyl-tripeptide--D-alanyl-D-alanine ligase [Micrococcus luteus]
MIALTAAQIAEAVSGTLSATLDPATVLVHVTPDSREVTAEGTLYVAKPGERADGHDFIDAALGAGAAAVLAERATHAPDGAAHPAIIVEDAVLAMGALAREVVRRIREHSPTTVIGITGSAGKTTTKDLLAALLATQGPTVAPVGSYNGEVGVPLTVFRAELDTRFLVVEMGADHVGNIAYLCDIVRPDIGVVLMVGTAHAGSFGGVANIARTKGELVEALGPDGVAVLNLDDERVAGMAARTAAPITWFTADERGVARAAEDVAAGRASGLVAARDVRADDQERPVFDLQVGTDEAALRHPVASGLTGLHHVHNVLAAAAAAHAAGMDPAEIARGLDGLGPASRFRMERTDRADGVTIINDAYNANPESMRAALRTLATLGRSSGRRTWAVLGEMLELGDARVREHTLVGESVVRLNIAQLLVVGAGARPLYIGALNEGSWGEEAHFVDDAAQAEAFLTEHLRPGDLVLVKSSNGVGLAALGERLATADAVAAPSASPKESRP